MIGFFRKIRKKLADDNQFFKYSRYAIGEIVLVVIGILIALQINNWSEEQQEADRITAQLVNLARDLRADRSGLEQLRSYHAFRVHASYYLLEEYNIAEKVWPYPEAGPIPELDESGLFGGIIPDTTDSDFIVRGFSWILRNNHVKPSTDAIDEFSSTGLFALFENHELKNDLRSYYVSYAFAFPFEDNGESNLSDMLKNSIASMGYSYLDIAVIDNPVEQLLSNPTNTALIKNIIDDSTYKANRAFAIREYLDGIILQIENEIDKKPSKKNLVF